MASAAARFLSESGRRGDFSEVSLEDADDYLSENRHTDDPQKLVITFGCYLGEVVCRVLDGRWDLSTGGLFDLEVQTAAGGKCRPILFVEKKLRHDGDLASRLIGKKHPSYRGSRRR